MSSIFVSDKDSFEVTVYYCREGEKFSVRNGKGFSESEKKAKDYKSITITCKTPSWIDAKVIVRECTRFENGRGNINFSELHTQLLRMLIKGWDMKDEDGVTDLPFSLDQLDIMRPEIARGLVDAVLQKLIEDGIYESILMS